MGESISISAGGSGGCHGSPVCHKTLLSPLAVCVLCAPPGKDVQCNIIGCFSECSDVLTKYRTIQAHYKQHILIQMYSRS